MRKKIKLRKKNKRLKQLLKHAWVHSGYPDCGYRQMTTEQKKLYCKVIGRKYDPDNLDY